MLFPQQTVLLSYSFCGLYYKYLLGLASKVLSYFAFSERHDVGHYSYAGTVIKQRPPQLFCVIVEIFFLKRVKNSLAKLQLRFSPVVNTV